MFYDVLQQIFKVTCHSWCDFNMAHLQNTVLLTFTTKEHDTALGGKYKPKDQNIVTAVDYYYFLAHAAKTAHLCITIKSDLSSKSSSLMVCL